MTKWSDVQFRNVRVLRLSGDGVLVIYAAEGAWKLAFHQQTPQEPIIHER